MAAGSLGLAAILACAPMGGPNGYVSLADENVVIVWDKARGIEHFVRQASFVTDQKKIGFIVPTPSAPTLSVADEHVFSLLRRQIPTPQTGFSLGCAHAKTAAKAAVVVLHTQRVGNYQAAVLKATDGRALQDWLAKNGFAASPSAIQWADGYAKRNWVFTAFKFTGGDDPRLATQTIRLSFKTDRPIYPYSMPRSDWDRAAGKSMRVYFVASKAVDAKYEGSNAAWSAFVGWSGSIEQAVPELAHDLRLSPTDLPASPTMTLFNSTGDTNGFGQDLYFVERRSKAPYAWTAGAAFGLALVWRSRARRHSEPPLQAKA